MGENNLQHKLFTAYWGDNRDIKAETFYQLMVELYSVDQFLVRITMEGEIGELVKQYSQEADSLLISVSQSFDDPVYQDFASRVIEEFSQPDLSPEKRNDLLDKTVTAVSDHINKYRNYLESNTALQAAFPKPELLEHRVATLIKYAVWKQFTDYLYSTNTWPSLGKLSESP